MEKILYIHIGNHKTGSTTIQYFCFKNIKKLEKLNIIYPKIGIPVGSFGHHNFAWEIIGDDRYNKSVGNISQLDQFFNLNKNLLISSEDFESLKSNNSIIKLLKMASKYDYKIKIILIIRKQEELLPSLIKEITKKGEVTQNINSIISNIINKGYLDFVNWRFWFNYKLQLNKIYEIFEIDKKNVNLLWYNKENLLHNFFKLIFNSSILTKIDIELSEYENLIINKSMSDLSFKMLNYFNIICKSSKIDQSRYNMIKNILTDNKIFFSRDNNFLSKSQKEILTEHFKVLNNSLIDEFK